MAIMERVLCNENGNEFDNLEFRRSLIYSVISDSYENWAEAYKLGETNEYPFFNYEPNIWN